VLPTEDGLDFGNAGLSREVCLAVVGEGDEGDSAGELAGDHGRYGSFALGQAVASHVCHGMGSVWV
jgi:hypothetical protein